MTSNLRFDDEWEDMAMQPCMNTVLEMARYQTYLYVQVKDEIGEIDVDNPWAVYEEVFADLQRYFYNACIAEADYCFGVYADTRALMKLMAYVLVQRLPGILDQAVKRRRNKNKIVEESVGGHTTSMDGK